MAQRTASRATQKNTRKSKKSSASKGAELPPAPEGFETPQARSLPALPVANTEDHLTAVALGPSQIFVHWGLGPEGYARARAALNPQGLTQALRVYLLQDQADTQAFDVEITERVGHQHLDLPEISGEAEVVVAMGLKDSHTFAHVVRSAPIRLPLPPCGAAT